MSAEQQRQVQQSDRREGDDRVVVEPKTTPQRTAHDDLEDHTDHEETDDPLGLLAQLAGELREEIAEQGHGAS